MLILWLQAPIPLEGTTAKAGRIFIHIFVCVRENCGKEPGSWRALRWEWPPVEPAGDECDRTQLAASHADTAPPISLWGLDASEDANFDFSDLMAALDKPGMPGKPMGSLQVSKEGPKYKGNDGSHDSSIGTEQDGVVKQPEAPYMPGFYLDIYTEAQCDTYKGNRADVSHIEELMARYELENGDVQGNRGAVPVGCGDIDRDQDDDAGEPTAWEGENYEEDAVLVLEGRKKVDRSILKFLKVLQRIPQQCLRAGGGSPLWPLPDGPRPTLCDVCGSPRIFTLQIMAPIISAIEEAADWLIEEGVEPAMLRRFPLSSDWETAAVYTCSKRCRVPQGEYREEYVAVALEE